ncbi:MAG: hypothetical protein WC675_01545 [Patescibacteria group bacterium]|jgi:hypothetical protein
MEYLENKINQLIVEKPGKQTKFVRSFATRPVKLLGEKIGKIFGLIEIESKNPKIPELIDLIIEEIKNSYYRQKEQVSIEKLPDISSRFETALKKTNLAITAFLESEQISLDLKKVNIIIALSCQQELHFTLVGNIGVILFYNLSLDNYRIINVLESTHSFSTEPDPLKLFSQIISGRIRPHDILFITTANVFDYFSLERIKNIITKQPSIEGVNELKKLLEEMEIKENFGSLTLELERINLPVKREADVDDFDYRKAASQDSIKELIRTEKETEKLLTPSLMPEIKKYTSSFKTAFNNYLDKVKTTTVTFYQKRKITLPKNISLPQQFNLKPKIKSLNKIGETAKKVTQPTIISTQKIFTNIANQPIWKKLLQISQRLLGNLWLRFKKLPRSSRILLVVTIILVILFSQSLIWLGIKNRREQKVEQFNQTIVNVETKKNNAESSLIYRDENQARQLLIEAKNLLNGLEPSSKAQKEQITLLLGGIEEQLQKLRHLVEITDPIQVVNFQNLDSQAKIAPILLASQKSVYTQNYNNQSIYKANLDTRVLAAIYSPTANTGNLKLGLAINNNELLFFNEAGVAFQLNPLNEAIQKIPLNINSNANIIDVTTFNNRIYLLDASANQIYRYTKTNGSYGNGTSWITEQGLDLASAKALTIDGSIYILKADGQVIKLENGKSAEWQNKVIDPPFKSPTKIKTTESSKYLYILDPPTKRLVVLDKTGNLINQYTSNSFDDLKDFIVVENQKEIYLLNGSSIFGIPTEHLK